MIQIVDKANHKPKEIKFPKIMDWMGYKIIILGRNNNGTSDDHYMINLSTGEFVQTFSFPGSEHPVEYNEPITIQNK